MIDLHYHLALNPDPLVLEALASKELFTLAVTESPASFMKLWNKYRDIPRLRIGLGLHPLLASKATNLDLEDFKSYVKLTNYVGEVGLDFSIKGFDEKEKQIEIFRRIAIILSGKRKLVSVHSRKAGGETLEVLQENNCNMVVFHWYTGTLKILQQILDAGYYFSINSAMTRNAKGQRIISRIPRDRVLTETDGPFVKVNGHSATPIDVLIVEKYLSNLWGISREAVGLVVKENLLRLIG